MSRSSSLTSNASSLPARLLLACLLARVVLPQRRGHDRRRILRLPRPARSEQRRAKGRAVRLGGGGRGGGGGAVRALVRARVCGGALVERLQHAPLVAPLELKQRGEPQPEVHTLAMRLTRGRGAVQRVAERALGGARHRRARARGRLLAAPLSPQRSLRGGRAGLAAEASTTPSRHAPSVDAPRVSVGVRCVRG